MLFTFSLKAYHVSLNTPGISLIVGYSKLGHSCKLVYFYYTIFLEVLPGKQCWTQQDGQDSVVVSEPTGYATVSLEFNSMLQIMSFTAT
jgi:hypothetical protein